MFNGIKYYGQSNEFSTYNYESSWRTKEEDAAGVGTKGYFNIVEAEKSLRFLINKKDEGLKKLNEEKYKNKTKLWELHIYSDGRPMEYKDIHHIKKTSQGRSSQGTKRASPNPLKKVEGKASQQTLRRSSQQTPRPNSRSVIV